MSRRDGDENIFVMDADGGNQTRITGNQKSAGNPSWSPDGQRIAFDAFKDKNFEIFVVGPDGKNLDRLTNNLLHDQSPAWSPDGSMIAFEKWEVVPFRHIAIHLMRSDGKHLKRLTNLPNHNHYHPDWTDSSWRAVSSTGNQITNWGRLKKHAPNLLKSDD